MARFDRGVNYFTTGYLNYPVHFPEDAVSCSYCPYCHQDSMERKFCRITGQMLYSKDTRPDDCPIEIDNKEET